MIENTHNIDTATLGSGCFWCTEAIFLYTKGVISVQSGYAGGATENPDYESVCAGNTGHAECVQIKFDTSIISYADILEIFWQTHDPTTLNRQGNDVGTQYRSVVFFHNETQKKVAEAYKSQLNGSGKFKQPIVTTIEPMSIFYPAEAYHDQYFSKHPEAGYCQWVIRPKLEKYRHEFAESWAK